MDILNWKGAGHRHDQLSAPMGNVTRLDVQVAIYVPSTNGRKDLSKSGFKSRVRSERKWMDNMWGGDTSVRASGGFTSDSGDLITEDVMIVESSTSVEEYRRNRNKFAKHIRERKNQWNQEAIGFMVEGVFFMYPDQGFGSTDLTEKINVV